MDRSRAFAETPFARVLQTMSETPATRFTEAQPFGHIAFDGLFQPELIAQLHGLFHTLPDDYWQKNDDHGVEVKWRSNWQSEYSIPEPAREVVRFFNSGIFLRELSRLTNIPNLLPDPYYTGGGFNLIKRGGHLDVHVDGNWHDAMRVHRRLNLLLYLNPNWRDEWGGALKFYDREARRAEVAISPRGNRLVVFETDDLSYHGHPEPLECPDHEGRTSIILYYYTSAPRPSERVNVEQPHSALSRSKEWTGKRGKKTRE